MRGEPPAGGLRKHVRVAQVRFVNFETINKVYESETESAHAHFLALESAQKVRNVFWQARGAKKRENSSYSPGSVMLLFFFFFFFFPQ